MAAWSMSADVEAGQCSAVEAAAVAEVGGWEVWDLRGLL